MNKMTKKYQFQIEEYEYEEFLTILIKTKSVNEVKRNRILDQISESIKVVHE